MDQLTFHQLLSNFQSDTLRSLCGADGHNGFLPELVIAATIVLMLLVRVPAWGRRVNAFYVALPGTLVALYLAAPWFYLAAEGRLTSTSLFSGMLVLDPLTVYFRGVLLVFLSLFLVFTRLSGIPDREDGPDIYTLVLGATLGMLVMASANHLFMVFMGVEMASVPSYALAGILKGRRTSSEAALKYSVYGAGASGVMLYGISLLAGALGTFHLPTIVQQLATLSPELLAERQTLLVSGGLMLTVGLAFKLSAVPFHFWCPDVFEGASAEVNAFLSVASKAAALALLVRVAVGFGSLPHPTGGAHITAHSNAAVVSVSFAADKPAADKPSAKLPAVAAIETPPGLAQARHFMVGVISLLAAITTTFGNLAAYGQKNIKRLLAYSTIAHAGYMMMPVAAALAVAGSDPALAEQCISAVCFYIGVYLFMNLGVFAIVAFVRNETRSESLDSYAGLIRRAPGVVICLGTIIISLLGLPPLSGFIAKLQVFNALNSAGLYLLLVIGGLNTVVSLFYYLGVVKVMTIDPEPQDPLPVNISMWSPAGVFMFLVTLPSLLLGIWWDQLNRWALAAAGHLFW